jgi:pimeloyl-ACP methyl ester carboxylesterase
VVLIGHSMGGPVALEAARRLKDRLVGIVGVDTFGNIGLPPAAPADVKRRLAPFRRDFAGTVHDYVPRNYFLPTSDPALVRRIADDMAAGPPEVAIGSMIGMNDMNYPAALGDIDVPIVAINAARGPIDVERIRLHARTFRLKTLSGVGHFVMIEDPTRFNELLEETLRELAPRS